jgi:L-aspartate oxidase
MRALLAAVDQHPDIAVLENRMVINLATAGWRAKLANDLPPDPDRVLGAYILNSETGRVEAHSAKVVVLCTGGVGKVYIYTSNPDVSTGDGLAMAYRAGARITNMEFIQFHPTCLYHPEAGNFLISEALRGEGGVLRLANGESFMHRYDERRELAPRDIVARAIDAELKRTGEECVFLDMTHFAREQIGHKFPNINARCMELGIDMAVSPIPVVPAAHYSCGGRVERTQPICGGGNSAYGLARRQSIGQQFSVGGDQLRASFSAGHSRTIARDGAGEAHSTVGFGYIQRTR